MKTENILIDLESTGFNLNDKISCICGINIATKERFSFYGIDEHKIITSFWDMLNKPQLTTAPKLYGFNTDSFDIPFLLKRSIINNIKVTQFTSVDIRKILNGFFYSYEKKVSGTLSDWAEALGLPRSHILGSEMPQLYYDKKFDEICAHCNEDVNMTLTLIERLINVGLLKI